MHFPTGMNVILYSYGHIEGADSRHGFRTCVLLLEQYVSPLSADRMINLGLKGGADSDNSMHNKGYGQLTSGLVQTRIRQTSPGNALMSSSDQTRNRHQRSGTFSRVYLPKAQPDPIFDRFARLACYVTGAPIALLTFQRDGQLEVKSALGTTDLLQSQANTPINRCLCQDVIEQQQLLSIPDTAKSDLAQECWLVERTGIRAYLGVPLTLADDITVGTLSVGDTAPRTWSAEDIAAINDIAILITEEIERLQIPDHENPDVARLSQSRWQKDQLQESELRKRAIVEAALDCIITIDHKGRILEFNAAAERTFGYSRHEAIGSLMADLIMTEASRHACLAGLERHLESGESSMLGYRIERQAQRADGTTIQVEMAVTRVDLPDREFPLFTAYVRDITERKQAEEEIRIHKHMVDAVGQAVIANDNSLERRITYWNKAAEHILGWKTEEVIGRGFYDVVPAPAFHGDVRRIGKQVRHGENWSGEFQMQHRNGHVVPALATVAPILNDDGELLGVISAYTDLTEIKQTEREIRLYKHIVDAIGESVVASDMNRQIFYANRAAERELGWSIDDVRGLDIRDVVPAKDFRDQSTRIGTEVRSTGERISGEFALRRTNGETFPALVTLAPIFGDNDELVGTIGIYTDISELKQTETDLRFHKHAIDAVGQAVISTGLDRTISYWNQAAEELLGWAPEEVIGKYIYDVAPAESSIPTLHNIVRQVRTGKPWDGELLLKHRNGREIPVLSSIRPVIGADGELLGIIGAHSDLTKIKETEREIRLYKHLTDAVGQALVANGLDRRITYWNAAAEETLGWKANEVIGRDFYEVAGADEMIEEMPVIGRQVRQGESWSGEFQLKHKDGRPIPVLMSVSPVLDSEGKPVQIIGAYTDVSDLKRTEEENRFFKHIVEAIAEAVVATSLEGKITYVNTAAEQMLGWDADELIGRDLLATIPNQSLIDEAQDIAGHVRTGRSWFSEFSLQRKDGSTFPALISLAPVTDESGATTGIISVYSEISELKRAEEENRFFKHVVDAVGQVVIANDMDRNITYWNQADEVVGADAATVAPIPDFLPTIPQITSIVRSGGAWVGEFPLQHRDGRTIPALTTLKPIYNEEGDIIGVLGAHTDIRELKATEQDLRFHKHIVDAVGQAVVVSDTAGYIIYWNKAAEEIYGWTSEEAIGQLVFNLLAAPYDTERANDITQLVATGKTWAGESPVKRKDGSEFPAYFTVSPIRDNAGEIVGIIGVSHDISDQKEYERQIEFHKIMLDAVGQTIVSTDMNRVITYWSKGAEQALGWSADEVIGRPIAEIAPAAHLQKEAGKLHKAVREGQPWAGEFPIRRKDGTTFPAVVSLAPVNLADQGTVGVIGVYTDVSELKQTAEELQLHKDLLDAVGQAVCATDEELRITYWNRAAEELYGYSASEAIGSKLLDFLPSESESLEQANSALELIIQEGTWTGEITTYHKDGSEITALVSASAILGQEGQHVGLIVAMADITARRRIEQQLQKSNEQITEILETMGDGFISISDDWSIQYVNRQAEQILGRSRESLFGKNFWDEFPEPDHKPFYTRLVQAADTGRAVRITEYDPFLSMWLEVHASPSPTGLSVFFRDVTERREREVALREAEQRYRTLVEQLPAMTYIAAPDDLSALTYVSPQVERMLGYSSSTWLSNSTFWMDLVHPEDYDYVMEQDARTIREGLEHFTLEYRLQASDGSYRWLRDTATLIRDIDGRPSYWQGLSYDITEEKRSERTIQENEQRFRSLFDNHPDAVFSIDRTGRVLSANPAFEMMTGYPVDYTSAFHFVDFVVPEDRRRVRRRFDDTHQGEPQDFRAAIIDPVGKRIELNLTTIPIIVDQDIVGVHVVAQDVTIHQELENQLAHQAYHDALTGLPNRNLFQTRLAERLERARQHQNLFAVLFFDLDDFKVINDSLGHSAGDQLLIEVAHRVQTCIRTNDLLARLGGDEFTLLLEHVIDDRDAIVIAERIASVLDERFIIDDHEVFATTSIGIAIGDAESPSSDDILRNADLAMYEAKNAGKNRYAMFEPSMNSRAWLRLTLESEIRRGIPQDEFVLHYQPIVDLSTGELDGVEALVRWNHPERGFLTPSEFISVAEQSGLILPLGRWIIREATTQLREWQSLLPKRKSLRLSLNLSPKQYQHPRLIEELSRTLTTLDFDPRLIILEITEGIAMDDSPDTIETLQQLKDVGVKLALDDFGTGFSALSYLRRFPIDIIKIDHSFVQGLGIDPEDTSIVRAVMAASLAMRLQVTAEGIETIDQLNMLQELGCQLGQGYLFAHPLPAEEMSGIITCERHSWHGFLASGHRAESDDS
jgi:diguanylate cyclase (GGDEF)-like protein/PAS domain S-box-containing protein